MWLSQRLSPRNTPTTIRDLPGAETPTSRCQLLSKLQGNQIWRPPNPRQHSKVLVVPMREKFMRLAHDSSGHMGLAKTVHALKQRMWWPALRSSMASYCKQCPTCARFKVPPVKPGGLLHPLPIPSHPWEDISRDLVTDLPVAKRKHSIILTVVDRFSKMAHFIHLV